MHFESALWTQRLIPQLMYLLSIHACSHCNPCLHHHLEASELITGQLAMDEINHVAAKEHRGIYYMDTISCSLALSVCGTQDS